MCLSIDSNIHVSKLKTFLSYLNISKIRFVDLLIC